ncbi:hypothetical protein HJFPF1_12248 [Paramyrothecium foliicola]|nr:hypothetical protein HJFPF1_12248 [Paramyrothecium foliicola]
MQQRPCCDGVRHLGEFDRGLGFCAERSKFSSSAAQHVRSCSSPSAIRSHSNRLVSDCCSADGLSHPSIDQTYTLGHFQLFQHICSQPGKFLMAEEAQARDMVQLLITNALALPYLMDETLAMAALHLRSSSSDLALKVAHECQASQLHQRARVRYDEMSIEDASGDGIGKYLFYSLWSVHDLLEMSIYSLEPSSCLQRLVRFLRTHQKMRNHKERALQVLRTTSLQSALRDLAAANPDATSSGVRACNNLSARIETTGLDPAALEACRAALKHLRWVCSVQEACTAVLGNKAHVVMGWPLLIPEHFVDLLDRRLPEALAIAAHYAALQHSCNDLWAFSDIGKHLVRVISGYLEPYCMEWLWWPNTVVRAAEEDGIEQ